VRFITTESGAGLLILSFAVAARSDPEDIESLSLVRHPVLEPFLDENERGISVSFDRHREDEEDRLEEVRYAPTERTVFLKTRKRAYLLDLRELTPKELYEMRKLFRKMNFDRRLRVAGL
jgi:hypothetical protein